MGRKRKNGEGTVRLRKDGRWEGRVVIGYDDKGLPKTKNVLAKTKSECVEKLKTLKDALAPPAPPRIKADMPFGDWMEHWYERHSRPAARPSTRRIYEGYLRLYISPGLGHIPLNRLTAKDMQQFFAWLKTEGRADQSDGKTGLADSQLRNIHSLCRRALERAVSEDLIPQNPVSGCKLPPARKGEMNILSRESMQKLLIRPHLGEKRISQIKAVDIQRFYDMLSRKLASGTVRRIHTTLHGILKAAAQARLIPRNPVEEVTPPKFSYQEKKVLTAEQVDRLLEAIQKDALWHDLFYTELTTGLRRGELCGLRWEDFDAANGTLKICRTVRREKGKGLTTGDTKTYAGTRTITLPPSLAVLLKERKRAAKTAWIFPDLLRPERPTAPDAAYRRMKLLLEQAGLPDIRFHDLRHTFATHALTSGVDVKTLSGILGHTRAAFTLDTYTHTTGDMQRRAAEIVGEFLTDVFGEELRPWEENGKMEKELSA